MIWKIEESRSYNHHCHVGLFYPCTDDIYYLVGYISKYILAKRWDIYSKFHIVHPLNYISYESSLWSRCMIIEWLTYLSKRLLVNTSASERLFNSSLCKY